MSYEFNEGIAKGFITALSLVMNADGVIDKKEIEELLILFGCLPGLKEFDKQGLIDLTHSRLEEIKNEVSEANIDAYIKEKITNIIPDDSYIKRCLVKSMFSVIQSDGDWNDSYESLENQMAIRIIENMQIPPSVLFLEGLANFKGHQDAPQKASSTENRDARRTPTDREIALGFVSVLTILAAADEGPGEDVLVSMLEDCEYVSKFDIASLLDDSSEILDLFGEDVDAAFKKISTLIPKDEDILQSLVISSVIIVAINEELNTQEIVLMGNIFDALEIPSYMIISAVFLAAKNIGS